jgi:hypothetical protein
MKLGESATMAEMETRVGK